MSLDFYIRVPEQCYYTRENGHMVSHAAPDCEYDRIHVGNITHNMNEMAEHVPVSDTLNLYNVLWRPEESNLNTTDDIYDYVSIGVKYMIEHKDELLQYNPDNGWGDYDALLNFTRRVGNACLLSPGCEIDADR